VNGPIELLARQRELRREAAIVRLAEARRVLDQALAACAQARQALDEAQRWKAEQITRFSLGHDPALREALLAACAALLARREERFTATQQALRQAHQAMTACQQDRSSRERELLRLQQWQGLQRDEHARQQATQENMQDEEWLPRKPAPHRGSTPRPTAHVVRPAQASSSQAQPDPFGRGECKSGA
jgi:hypothetical protein